MNTPTTIRRRLREALAVCAAVMLALALAGCGGGGTTPPTNNPVPSITSISPTTATAGGTGFTLTVTGSGFVSSSIVQWNGGNQATSFVSGTSLTASILAGDIANPGTVQVAVFNPAPGGGTSNAVSLTVQNGVPSITSLSPSSSVATGPAFTLTVNGTNFVPSSVVQWNGSARGTIFVSNTKLTTAITAADIANVSTAQVTVVNPAPGGGTSNPATSFSITAPQPMSILTTSLPGSGAGKSYYFVMSATGGVPPLNWSVSAGSLPSGLALDAATDTVGNPPNSIAGRIRGNITGSTATFTVRVADSAVPTHHTATQQMQISVANGALPRNNLVCSPSNVSDVATPISNGTIRASISPYNDIDVYSFHVSSALQQVAMEVFAQRLELDGDPSTQDSHLDSIMELLNSSCQTIALNDDISLYTVIDSKISISSTPFPSPPCPPSGSSPCADITPPTSLAPGTYYIRIRDFRSDGRPDFIYDLTLSGAD